MKNLFLFIAILAIASSCGRNSSEKAKPVALRLTTHKEAIDSLQKDSTAPRKPIKITAISPKKTTKFFIDNDISKLFYDPGQNPENVYNSRFDGFYGEDHYRIEFFLTEVKKDSLQPAIYHIKGKNRFKNTITNFEGTISFSKLSILSDPNIQTDAISKPISDVELNAKQVYSAEAVFELKEEEKAKGSGVFSGNLFIDFFEQTNGNMNLWFYTPDTYAMASGFKFEGQWTNYKKTLTRPVVWAKDLFAFSNTILTKFAIGDREVEINPKYRHLGWDKYWENDEWWHEQPVQ